ncbi:Ubiquitin elongating factor core [Teratosphaeria destructans]|uniref:Ubiquitin elongating factor core n=1 Tax=Teratosphaeria destructans TaxID=418781 RepID=A0A9W7SJR1_9PEZI|nr:Ubiquitin elongating factor core [Teratosphaeria destructans]
MADSNMSDADRIRAKRLAKLGGPAASPTPPQNAQTPPPPATATTPAQPSPQTGDGASEAAENPFAQLGMKEQTEEKKTAPQIKIRPRPSSPAKRDSGGSERPRQSESRPRQREPESLEAWQDRTLRAVFRVSLKPEETKDLHGNDLIFLAGTREELSEAGSPIQLTVDSLEGVITEAAGQAPKAKPFEYLLQCFKRAKRTQNNVRYGSKDEARLDILKETLRLCMSYCIFAVTMPEMFGDNVPAANPLVDHLLVADRESEVGICSDFLDEATSRMSEDDSIREAVVGAVEELSARLSKESMLGGYRNYVHALKNLTRYKSIAVALTESAKWLPGQTEPQNIETQTLLGPFYRLSPMQPEPSQSFFSAPKTRDRAFIFNAQNAIRMELRNHQEELLEITNFLIKADAEARGRTLDWFAACVNKNHKKRAMRVDYKTVSSDGFMLNVTVVLDRLCDPFIGASFEKIDRIHAEYFRRKPRVDISDETKINADQKAADAYYAQPAEGTNNFISEVFFLTVAAHHYGTEAAQERMGTLRKSVKRYEQDMAAFEADRHKFAHDPRYLARFEEQVKKAKKSIDDMWSTIHATEGVLLDTENQARSMQFMRYVIVWLLRLASGQDLPKQRLQLPLPAEQSDVFKYLPEYFLEDIVENFKFITRNLPQIMTPQQCDEIVQVCITFLRNSEYVKNPGVKSGLVTILFYGVQPFGHNARGLLGDLLIGSGFAHKHLLHALMKYYIEAESTGTHTQFYDKFNIRFEIFQVIKCIWVNTMYRENLSKEAQVNTDFFVQFVNMIVNDVTFVLDESLTSFSKIHNLTEEMKGPAFAALDEEQRKEKQELLEDQKGKAKSYSQLTRESMETLILFTETLPDAFTMPEIVQRLADMLDYNLDIMVGNRRKNLKVENPAEYKWDPKALLIDIIKVFLNLSAKERFSQAIAKDGRSYKPENFAEAARLMSTAVYMAPAEIEKWTSLGDRVAAFKAAEEEEEADLGEVPDEFLDPLLADLMTDPVILPTSKNTVDRATIRSHLLSDPNDPFNRMPLKIEDVIPNSELKQQIDEWKAKTLAAKRAEKAAAARGGEPMDTSQG